VSLRCENVHSAFIESSHFSSSFISIADNLQRSNKGFGDPCVNPYTFEFT